MDPRRRVAIVDNDLWVRNGRAEALRAVPGIEVPFVLDHHEALELQSEWDALDVALVDAYDDAATFDRFPGVQVVEAIRSRRTPEQITISVISGLAHNDHLRLRMAAAGADYFYSHEQVQDRERLAELVLCPHSEGRLPSPSELTRKLDLQGTPAVAEALDYVREQGLAGVFDRAVPLKAVPRGRRSMITARRRLAGLTGVKADPAQQVRRVADWHRLVDFVNRARGVELRRPRD